MADAVHDARGPSSGGGYLGLGPGPGEAVSVSVSARNLRHLDDRLFVQRIGRDDQQDRHAGGAYRSVLACRGPSPSRSPDAVEFVTLEDFLISDPGGVFDTLIQQPQPTSHEEDGEHAGLRPS